MEEPDIVNTPVVLSAYNLTEEQEKKEILRHYRALLRALCVQNKKR